MNFRLITLAGCVALGSIGLAGKADAQATATSAASTSIAALATAAACTITAPTAVVLARTPGGLNAVEAGSGITGLGATGTAGDLNVTCPSGGSLTIAAPTGTSPTGFNPVVRQAVVELTSLKTSTSASIGGNFDTGAWNRPNTPLTIPASSAAQALKYGMIIGTNAAGSAPAGAYGYTVVFTATSN